MLGVVLQNDVGRNRRTAALQTIDKRHLQSLHSPGAGTSASTTMASNLCGAVAGSNVTGSARDSTIELTTPSFPAPDVNSVSSYPWSISAPASVRSAWP